MKQRRGLLVSPWFYLGAVFSLAVYAAVAFIFGWRW